MPETTTAATITAAFALKVKVESIESLESLSGYKCVQEVEFAIAIGGSRHENCIFDFIEQNKNHLRSVTFRHAVSISLIQSVLQTTTCARLSIAFNYLFPVHLLCQMLASNGQHLQHLELSGTIYHHHISALHIMPHLPNLQSLTWSARGATAATQLALSRLLQRLKVSSLCISRPLDIVKESNFVNHHPHDDREECLTAALCCLDRLELILCANRLQGQNATNNNNDNSAAELLVESGLGVLLKCCGDTLKTLCLTTQSLDSREFGALATCIANMKHLVHLQLRIHRIPQSLATEQMRNSIQDTILGIARRAKSLIKFELFADACWGTKSEHADSLIQHAIDTELQFKIVKPIDFIVRAPLELYPFALRKALARKWLSASMEILRESNGVLIR